MQYQELYFVLRCKICSYFSKKLVTKTKLRKLKDNKDVFCKKMDYISRTFLEFCKNDRKLVKDLLIFRDTSCCKYSYPLIGDNLVLRNIITYQNVTYSYE